MACLEGKIALKRISGNYFEPFSLFFGYLWLFYQNAGNFSAPPPRA
jgi:hypothetical protein